MKLLALACLALAAALPLRADEAIQNGDFADGITHWHGDARSPADFASDNPLQASDPLTAKGLIIPLKHTLWAKCEQDFTTKFATGVLRISYKVSPDFALSTKTDDYANPSGALGWGWKEFATPPGAFLIFFTSGGGTKGHYYEFRPKQGFAGVQTATVKVDQMAPGDEQTLTLALPPGLGTIIFLGVSVNDH
jgi:hypothetical protein